MAFYGFLWHTFGTVCRAENHRILPTLSQSLFSSIMVMHGVRSGPGGPDAESIAYGLLIGPGSRPFANEELIRGHPWLTNEHSLDGKGSINYRIFRGKKIDFH